MNNKTKILEDVNSEIKKNKESLNKAKELIVETNKEKIGDWWTVKDAMTVSTVLLGFFLLVLILATYLIKLGTNTEVILKFFGTILIICTTSFLIIVGYDKEQITPVIGLLGTIAGYLLGKSDANDNSITQHKKPK